VHVVPTSWPPVFVLGTLFAVLYDQTRSIWPAVGVHAILNSVALVVSFFAEVSGL
jgi:membrane protease YdiL (CAAX protease family)